MGKLIKANIFRVLKSKLFFISLIIAVALPLMTVASFKMILSMTDALKEIEGAMLAGTLSGRGILASNYNLSNNIGLIVPIFAGVFVILDFSSGSLRNKIIAGQKRNSVYLSHFITSALYAVLIVSLNMAFTALFIALFQMDYGVEINSAEIWNIAKLIISGTLTYIFVASLSTLIAMSTRSLPLTIILSLTFALIVGIIVLVVPKIPTDNIEYLGAIIPSYCAQFGIEDAVFIEGNICTVLFSVINIIAGTLLFKFKDIK